MNLPEPAKTIAAKVLRELQEADEIGGPAYPEYIALMEHLQREVTDRLETAKAIFAAMNEQQPPVPPVTLLQPPQPDASPRYAF